jgi:hypothetical protein
MQASDALQRVLKLAENSGQYHHGVTQEERDAEAANFHQDQEALKICTDILSVAVPIARFRCFVTIEKIGTKSKLGLGDFTIVAVDIPGIKNGLIGLSMESVSVYIQLWEHREEGKFDMLCGYQGQTKNLGFRNWLKDIDRHNDEPNRIPNNIEARNGSSQ